jgi:hypothetical protein
MTNSNLKPDSDSTLPCTAQPLPDCAQCETGERLMCRYKDKDLLNFFSIVLPYAAAMITGAILAGKGIYLLLWLAYSFFFFFVWEARVLCRHCPYWAASGSILECHANSGVVKIWNYQTKPMSKSERTQFIVGALIWLVFPFPFLLLGGQYWIAFIGFCAACSCIYILYYNVCNRCPNFSCPLNNVPKVLVDAYLKRNPKLLSAWQEAGYQIEKQD